MTDNTHRPAGGDIHRLLDEAFSGIEMTPETQDLKEEVRANLLARVADLEASGTASTDAAHQAIDELGDVREFVGAAVGDTARGASAGDRGSYRSTSQAAAYAVGRVRPKPAFIVGIVIASLAATAGLVLGALSATGVLPLPLGPAMLLLGITATGLGWIVGDSLSQETTTNHPMPQRRASGYALATFLTVYGLGVGSLVAFGTLDLWTVVFAALGVVAGVILFSFLGATQTNRHKAWVRQVQREYSGVGDRFEREPEVAARFGIYTMVIWVVAFAVFLVLSFTIGWAWSWLALLGGFVAMMLTLARMLFVPSRDDRERPMP